MPSKVMSFARAAVFGGFSLVTSQSAQALDPLPHLARYQVFLGAGPQGPAIGNAVQRLSNDCRQWTLEREVHVDLSYTPSLRMRVNSQLKATQSLRGDSFTYALTRTRNDVREQITGTVTMVGGGGGHAALRGPNGPVGLDLPARTALPVSAIAQAMTRLKSGGGNFSITSFDPETLGNTMQVDVAAASRNSLRQRIASPMVRPPAATDGWPVTMTFSSARHPGSQPLYIVNGLLLDSGALDRLTIRSGFLTFAADLVELQPIDTPQCPRV